MFHVETRSWLNGKTLSIELSEMRPFESRQASSSALYR